MIRFHSALLLGVAAAAIVVGVVLPARRPAPAEISRRATERSRIDAARVPLASATSAPTEAASSSFADILGRLAPGADESDIAALIAALSGCRDRALVLRVIEALPDATMQAYVVNRLVETWARTDPAAVAAWLDALPAAIDTMVAQVTVHRIWAGTDAPAAVSHALAIWKTSGASEPLAAGISAWIVRDAAAAGAWIAAQPRDPVLDRAAAELARSDAVVQQPDIAIRWAQRISNDGQRLQSLETFFARWLDVDRFAARQYLRSSQLLSEQDRSELRESLRIVEDGG
jgi:hypothetical protein